MFQIQKFEYCSAMIFFSLSVCLSLSLTLAPSVGNFYCVIFNTIDRINFIYWLGLILKKNKMKWKKKKWKQEKENHGTAATATTKNLFRFYIFSADELYAKLSVCGNLFFFFYVIRYLGNLPLSDWCIRSKQWLLLWYAAFTVLPDSIIIFNGFVAAISPPARLF